MRSATWITFRAVVALMLMVGFYLLEIAVAALLLLVPYAEFAYCQLLRVSPRISVAIAAVCIGAAGSSPAGLIRTVTSSTNPFITPRQ